MKEVIYTDILKANETIQTTSIKGKDYAEVSQRIKAFRMVYPTGFIINEIIDNSNGVCIFMSKVGYYSEDGKEILLGTGTAYEKENSTFINKTSYIENCETSAVGRALGMLGFGIDTSVASAEEVVNAMNNQNATNTHDKEDSKAETTNKKASAKQVEILSNTYTGENLVKLLSVNNVEKLEDLPMTKASELISKLKK